jgi:hypothetical protein
MTAQMGDSGPTSYRMFSTAQLEDMFSRSTRWDEQLTIGEELNRRRANRGPGYQQGGAYDPQLPPRSTAAPGFIQGQRPSYPPPQPPRPAALQPNRRNRLAVASLVCGLLGFTGIGAIAGLIVGYMALKQIKASGQAGRGLAIAGIVLSALFLLGLAGTL